MTTSGASGGSDFPNAVGSTIKASSITSAPPPGRRMYHISPGPQCLTLVIEIENGPGLRTTWCRCTRSSASTPWTLDGWDVTP